MVVQFESEDVILNMLLMFRMARLLKVIVHSVHANKHKYSVHNTGTQFFTHHKILILFKCLCLKLTRAGNTLVY